MKLLFLQRIINYKMLWFLSFLLFLFVLNMFFHIIAMNVCKQCNAKFNDNIQNFSVLTFNIHGSDQDWYLSQRVDSLFALIKNNDADFVLLNEYYASCSNKLDTLIRSHYRFSSSIGRHDISYGEMIYSKYPIENVEAISDSSYDNYSYHAVINKANEKISVYCCHLRSNNYDENNNRFEFSEIKSLSNLYKHFPIYNYSSKKRGEMTDKILSYVSKDKNKYIIIAGDMNDFCFSSSIRKLIRAGFSDSWWEGGNGYGGTFKNGFFAFRIDYIFYNNYLSLSDIKLVNTGKLSDHNALKATFCLR